MKNIFVGNLSFQTTEDELRTAFERYGEVLSVKTITDRETGRARGFAFIEMANAEEADRAIAELNGGSLDGRTLTVNEAKQRPERDFSGRNRGGGGGFRQNDDQHRRRY